ncbi:hypothetical protein CHLRE_06g260700v5 [Chlamydomonas reinhardtii]|uniref:Adenine/guanine permease AZG1 n=1 Tax=Chlamydomonas reinhardtii TaxID=3055 RepID=A0A2K3DMN4_CHLRE|nr:uncharacterized protein CHLRE_06g260700v5 [Chlamydomonas reinhardtii]PNW81797.1 hypothetical protein CHLRE_06g260700v5 [Chlamydomonas reinhardtii]
MEDGKAPGAAGTPPTEGGAIGIMFERLNRAVEESAVGRYFCLKERKSRFTTELRAGTVTFLTMAYILAVNGAIVADTGGPCGPSDCTQSTGPFCMFGPPGGTGMDVGYLSCRENAKRSMVTATAVSSFVACVLMGVVGNLPFGLAPGMGINAFFTYTVVGFAGVGGMITYQDALAAAFIEGWIFFVISISGLRGKITQIVPKCVMLATSGGIGIFLAFIGMQTSNGIGLIAFEPATLVTLAGCPIQDRAHMYTIADPAGVCSLDANGNLNPPSLGPASPNYACITNMKMRSASLWLGICGGILMVLLMARGFRGAIMVAILFVTFISWIPNHDASYLGASSQIPGGEERMAYFKKVVQVPNTSATDLEMDFSAFGTPKLWAALISFLYLDLLDCTGTFYSMAAYIDKRQPGFINPITKTFPRMTLAFSVDATAIWVGALLGIPPLTTYIESATGIREGGRTGITAIMIGFYFFLAMFFTPIISSIPPYATGPALILVGSLMMENLLDIDWKDYTQAIPAFITISVIPLTYSIAYGIIGGIMSYVIFYVLLLIYDLLSIPLTGKNWRDVLAAAKPEFLKPMAVLEQEEIARNRARIDAMERQLEEMNVALAHAESSSISDKQSTDATVAKGVAEAVEAAHVPAGGPVGFETHESEQQKPQQQPGGPNAV